MSTYLKKYERLKEEPKAFPTRSKKHESFQDEVENMQDQLEQGNGINVDK